MIFVLFVVYDSVEGLMQIMKSESEMSVITNSNKLYRRYFRTMEYIYILYLGSITKFPRQSFNISHFSFQN